MTSPSLKCADAADFQRWLRLQATDYSLEKAQLKFEFPLSWKLFTSWPREEVGFLCTKFTVRRPPACVYTELTKSLIILR